MRIIGRAAIAATLFTSACAPGVSGVVRDAATDAPVAGAVVELGNVGWGTRDGQLVWDAEQTTRTTTDAAGSFAFDEDGGTALRVKAAGRPSVETSLCPRSPSLVRVGGPYPGLRANERLLFGPSEGATGTPAAELGLIASGNVFSGGTALQIDAAGGVRFVEGRGVIPPAPLGPYNRSVAIDVTENCGWLFVSDGSSPVAVIEVAAPGLEQEPDGTRRHVMLFTPLPRPS